MERLILKQQTYQSRAPRGARGLKCYAGTGATASDGRAPRGARGLKSVKKFRRCNITTGRAPRGARGLKSCAARSDEISCWSCPSRGTWIEIRETWSKLLEG